MFHSIWFTHFILLKWLWVTFGCFQKEINTKGGRYAIADRTFDNVPQVLKKIPKEEFQKYFEQWQHPWNKGVAPKVIDWKEAAIIWMYKCWYVFCFLISPTNSVIFFLPSGWPMEKTNLEDHISWMSFIFDSVKATMLVFIPSQLYFL